MTVFLDTHVAAFLHAGDAGLFSPQASHMLNAATEILLSPMVVLELQYLFEVGKIAYPGDQIAAFLEHEYSVGVDRQGLGQAVLNAATLSWTRDPFDRTITAHAAFMGAFLLTRDATIRAHYAAAVW